MKRSKKESRLRFSLFMVLYALFLLSAASVALYFLWNFCDNYERSLPSHKMNEYISSLTEKRVKRLSVDFVATLDRNVQSEADSYEEIWKAFSGGIKYRRIASADGTENRQRYAIINGTQQLGTVTLVRDPTQRGEKTWKVEEENYDFSFLIHSKRFIVPQHWVVMCGSRRLGVQYIIDTRVKYDFVEEFYDKGFPMPYLVEYEIGNFVGDPRISFFDPDGMEQAPFVLTDGKDQMPRAGKATSRELITFVDQFLPLYILCLANPARSAQWNYTRIKPLLYPNSEIDKRLHGAIDGQVFAQSRAVHLKDVAIHDVYDLGNTYYLIDLSYTVDTTTDKGHSITDTDMYLAVLMEEKTTRAVMVNLY